MALNRRAGMALMLLASACIGIQAFFVKLATAETDAAEVAFLRFLISYLIMRIAIGAGWIEVRLVNRRLVWTRGLLGGVGNLLYFYAIAATRLSNAIVLLYTYPIFAGLYGHAILRRGDAGARLSPGLMLVLAASFAGVVLIVDPAFDRPGLGDLLGLLAGVTVGGAIVSLKESRRTDSAWTIFHYFNIAGLALSLPLALRPFSVPPVSSLGALAGVVVFSFLGQVWMTHAFRYTGAAEGGALSTFGAVVGSALGIGLLGEPARPGFIAGAALIVAGGIYLTLREAPR